jgi:hypothetical protein
VRIGKSKRKEEPEKAFNRNIGEFDPGSGRTLAACLTHASRAEHHILVYDA